MKNTVATAGYLTDSFSIGSAISTNQNYFHLLRFLIIFLLVATSKKIHLNDNKNKGSFNIKLSWKGCHRTSFYDSFPCSFLLLFLDPYTQKDLSSNFSPSITRSWLYCVKFQSAQISTITRFQKFHFVQTKTGIAMGLRTVRQYRSSHWRCSFKKKLFLKISQFSQENICIRASF